MPTYRVPVSHRDIDIIEVEADNKEQAMELALSGEGNNVESIEGDSEVYYNDIWLVASKS